MQKVFSSISLIGFILTLTEFILRLFHTSACHTEGCKLVSQYVRFGDTIIIVAGLVVFGLLASLSFLNLALREKRIDLIINFLLVVALACEGFLTGYQAFRLHKPCAFCLAVLAIFIALGILRVLDKHKDIIVGFACFIVIFGLFYLILPATNQVCIPKDKELVLFYDNNCPHCKEIINECQQCNIQVCLLPVRRYIELFKSLRISQVPVLLINGHNEKRVLIGATKIRNYLQRIQARKGVKDLPIFSKFSNLPASASACMVGKEQCK